MDFITATVLSGIIYDMIKYEITLSTDNLKDKLRNWVVDEAVLSTLSSDLNKLELTKDLSESAIENKILTLPEIQQLLESIKPVLEGNTIIQSNVNGDNIGRDKVTNDGK